MQDLDDVKEAWGCSEWTDEEFMRHYWQDDGAMGVYGEDDGEEG